jgi:uroporphyrinogen decarboxylase
MAEDICFNHGPLISPDMIREFLFPYYQQLIASTRRRQLDRARPLFHPDRHRRQQSAVIDVYREIGMNYMSPFEVASGCDVVAVGADCPDLLMRGGIDKRILARDKEAIDREMDRILPVLFRRGGYIPVCDHGVPEEVSFENYCHFRRRVRNMPEPNRPSATVTCRTRACCVGVFICDDHCFQWQPTLTSSIC